MQNRIEKTYGDRIKENGNGKTLFSLVHCTFRQREYNLGVMSLLRDNILLIQVFLFNIIVCDGKFRETVLSLIRERN